MRVTFVIALAILSYACATPKPRTVDGSAKQAINSASTVEILKLRAELARLKDEQPPPVNKDPVDKSKTFQIPFKRNGVTLQIPWTQETELLTLITNASQIEIRGRTDAKIRSRRDEAVALKRALVTRRYLVAHGVSPSKINLNYMSGGDFVADNETSEGRYKNRRVEIEVFFKGENQ